MLFSIATSTLTPSTLVPDHYLLTHFLAITHTDFSSTPADLSLVPWYRIRAELCHGRGSIKPGGGCKRVSRSSTGAPEPIRG